MRKREREGAKFQIWLREESRSAEAGKVELKERKKERERVREHVSNLVEGGIGRSREAHRRVEYRDEADCIGTATYKMPSQVN